MRSILLLTLSVPTVLMPVEHARAEEGFVLDEVVVTATRRDAGSYELSGGLSVLTGKAVAAELLVTDSLAEIPGVALQQTTPGQGAVIVRGLKGSSVLHLVDGLRLNNAIFRSAPTQYLALVPVTAIERIEVLRGTQPSLYGSDAVGGIVQLVSRFPEFDSERTETSGELQAGYRGAELARTLRGRLDLGNRTVASSLSAEYLRTGDRRIGGGERIGPSAYEARAARLATVVTPDDGSRWIFDAQYVEQPETPRVDELVPGFGQTEPSSAEFLFAPNRRVFLHAGYEDSGLFGLDWRMDIGWQRIDDDRITRNGGSDLRRFEQNRSDLGGAVVTASRATESGSWVAGLEIYRDQVTSSRIERDIVTQAETVLTPRFPDGADLDRAAIFANADRALSGGHFLNGGIRLSTVRVTLPDTPVTAATDVEVTDLSGDIGWRYDLSATWQLVANLGFGFRAPNVFDLGSFGNRPGNRFNIPNTALESEHGRSADFGVRYHGARFKLDAMVFALTYDDRITSVLTGETTPDGRDIVQSANAASSELYGVEIGMGTTLSDRLSLEAVLNYTRGEDKIDGVVEPADRVPPLGGRVALHYAIDNRLTLDGWLRFADRQDRLSARDVRDVRINPEGTAGWAVFGAELGWNVGNSWSLALGVDNVFDKRYRRHGSGIDAPGVDLSFDARYRW